MWIYAVHVFIDFYMRYAIYINVQGFSYRSISWEAKTPYENRNTKQRFYSDHSGLFKMMWFQTIQTDLNMNQNDRYKSTFWCSYVKGFILEPIFRTVFFVYLVRSFRSPVILLKSLLQTAACRQTNRITQLRKLCIWNRES